MKDPLSFKSMFPNTRKIRNDPLSLSNMIGNQRPWKMNFNIDLSNPTYYPNPYRTQRPARRPSKPQPRFTRQSPQQSRPRGRYFVAVEQDGVQRIRNFNSQVEARAFRRKLEASGQFDNVSQVRER